MRDHTTRPAAAWQERFTQLPDGLHQLVTSPREFQLIALLLSYRWSPDAQVFPSVRTLAERLNCSERTVQRTCASLEARGLLVREYRYRDESERDQTSNGYHLAGALLALVGIVVDTRVSPDRHPPVTRTAGERHSGNNNNRKSRPVTVPRQASAYLETRGGRLRPR